MKELERSLGPIALVAISLSSMLGSGIFVLPGLAAAKSGPSVWLAYLLAGLCVLPAAFSKAELAAAMPSSGGTYVYLDRTFGPLYGTIAGVALWLSMLLKSAFALVGFGTYFLVFADTPLKPMALGFLVLIAGLNVLGVRKVGQAQVAIILIAVVGLSVLLGLSFSEINYAHFIPMFPQGIGGLLSAMGFVLVSYNGVTKVAAIAEEVRNPSRNIPLAILISLALAMLIYAFTAFALVSGIPQNELIHDLHPVYTLAKYTAGPVAGFIAAALGVLTMISMANAGLLAASRFPFAMARGNLLPKVLQNVHPRFRTPIASILITSITMGLAVVFIDVERLAKLASAIIIMTYIAENIAVVILRESRVRWYQPKYRAPAYPWVQVMGVVCGVSLLISLGAAVPLATLGVMMPGIALFFLYGRRRTDRLGVFERMRTPQKMLRTEPPSPPAADDTHADAAVVVALFGEERCPEMLAEVGIALADGHKVQTVHLTEVHEQSILDSYLDEDAAVKSLRRRINALGQARHTLVDFRSVLCRDLARSVRDIASRVHCQWLVMEWHGRTPQTFLPFHPIGWLINHLDANLALYRDVGIRYVRHIVVYAEPGPHDSLVVDTADHLALTWGTPITFIRFVPEESSEDDVNQAKNYLRQLEQLCSAPVQNRILRGHDQVKTIASSTASYDLLIMGSPDVTLMGMVRGSIEDQIASRSSCSVLTVRTPHSRTHAAYQKKRASMPSLPVRIQDHSAATLMFNQVNVRNKEALFTYIAKSLSDHIANVDQETLNEALWQRERTQNTAVGSNIALPHASLANLDKPYVGIFVLSQALSYDAADGQKVDILFVTLSTPQERQLHLSILSKLSALALKTDLVQQLRQAENAEAMATALHACEESLAYPL